MLRVLGGDWDQLRNNGAAASHSAHQRRLAGLRASDTYRLLDDGALACASVLVGELQHDGLTPVAPADSLLRPPAHRHS